MPDAHEDLAAAVRSALEASGLTVAQVSAETRIRGALVQDLLEGRTASSGGDVYVRGHLRAIAHATRTDPSALIGAFERATGATLAPVQTQETVSLHGQTAGSLALPLAERPERRGPRWGLALAGAGLALVGLVVTGSLLGEDDGSARASSPTVPPPTAGVGTPAPAPTRTVAPTPTRASGAALRVVVAGGSSWVQVRDGVSTVFEGILDAGAVRDFRGPSVLSVRVGNAGAVSLTCAGRGAAAGAAGQVRSFSCAPDGLSPV